MCNVHHARRYVVCTLYITEFSFRRILLLNLDEIKFGITNYLCTKKFILIIVKILFC